MADEKHDNETGTITRVKPKSEGKLQRPSMFKVLLHNDDYTTREFVVEVLRQVFHRTSDEAVQIMLHVHNNGVGVAGTYTHEIAEMKVRLVQSMAETHEYPLMLSIEAEE